MTNTTTQEKRKWTGGCYTDKQFKALLIALAAMIDLDAEGGTTRTGNGYPDVHSVLTADVASKELENELVGVLMDRALVQKPAVFSAWIQTRFCDLGEFISYE